VITQLPTVHQHVHPAIRRLARCTLAARGLLSDSSITLGSITLLPHQCAAIRWLLPRIARFGGALLADPPGLGKTFVALGIARALGVTPLVIAPASLRTRWREAERDTEVPLDFVSVERLSARGAAHVAARSFVIVDEAHHARTLSTQRRTRLEALCKDVRVLLLSATPIHNHSADLQNLIALFHLPPTKTSRALLRRGLTLRRTLAQIRAVNRDHALAVAVPDVRYRNAISVGVNRAPIAEAITQLPPLPNDGDGHALLQSGLLHALRSSDAATRARLRRRVAVTLAIEHSAAAGVVATHALRKAWHSAEGCVQLAMPTLLGAASSTPSPTLIRGAIAQREALERVLPLLDGWSDQQRATVLRRLARWNSGPVVAFTQFHETAIRFYHLLRNETGVAVLSGSGALIASGVISRPEVLERLLSPRFRTRHNAVRLLIATDVLSEGLSLAGVTTVVHLDLPWTAARLDQRVGRAARIGAPVHTVQVVRLVAPIRDDGAATRHTALLDRKRRVMDQFEQRSAEDSELLRMVAELANGAPQGAPRARWLTTSALHIPSPRIVALVRLRGRKVLVAMAGDVLRAPVADDWTALQQCVPIETQRGYAARFCAALESWLTERDLTARVHQLRDHRLERRQAADDMILRGTRGDRSRAARDVSALRNTIMTLPGTMRSGPRTQVQIIVGVVMVPA
jgi:superfamily II DNA or RNA helicase